MFDRSPDQSGETAWLDALAAGATRQQVASLIDASSEREATVVSAYYQAYLGRAGSSSDINYWVGILENGATREQVMTLFLASSEFLARESGTLSGWLTGVYEASFKRTPDAGGFDAWIRVLNSPFAS